MDKVKGKRTNDNQHSHGQQFYGRVFLTGRVFIWQNKVGNLYDVELVVQADRVRHRTVREQPVSYTPLDVYKRQP